MFNTQTVYNYLLWSLPLGSAIVPCVQSPPSSYRTATVVTVEKIEGLLYHHLYYICFDMLPRLHIAHHHCLYLLALYSFVATDLILVMEQHCCWVGKPCSYWH